MKPIKVCNCKKPEITPTGNCFKCGGKKKPSKPLKR